jgi:dTDP-4-dehydrorhamnose 3,5-epimerase
MKVENLPLAGALMLTPRVFADERGSFLELFSLERYRECGIGDSFVQDNSSLSRRNVLRGLHGDARMAKLVSVLRGSAYDVIVDVRATSATYGQWHGTTLTAADARQIYVPRGFLHGFLTLEESTIFWYKQSAPYDPACEVGVAWDDADLGIGWPLGEVAPILSLRDAANPPLRALRDRNKLAPA